MFVHLLICIVVPYAASPITKSVVTVQNFNWFSEAVCIVVISILLTVP